MGALIPVEERTCSVCKENCIEHEQHFFMYCQGYPIIRRELHSHILNAGASYIRLREDQVFTKSRQDTAKIIGKFIHLIFQKRRDSLFTNEISAMSFPINCIRI